MKAREGESQKRCGCGEKELDNTNNKERHMMTEDVRGKVDNTEDNRQWSRVSDTE